MEIQPWYKALPEKLRGYIFKPTSSENTFEEIFFCAEYLRAILLITYLFLREYDGTDFT